MTTEYKKKRYYQILILYFNNVTKNIYFEENNKLSSIKIHFDIKKTSEKKLHAVTSFTFYHL